MPLPRVMGDAVILPNGKVVVLNGAMVSTSLTLEPIQMICIRTHAPPPFVPAPSLHVVPNPQLTPR